MDDNSKPNMRRGPTDELLRTVQVPGRYINREWNCAPRPGAAVRIALCYPDVYQIGMDHLGLLILLHVAQSVEGVSAERCFAPWPDVAAQLREHGLPLCTLETGTPLCACDIIGFTLQYELTYATILAMLDMGGVPIRSDQRRGGDPIVIAGGPGATNPEPLAPFIDLFCIGDGEELLAELLQRYKELIAELGPRESWDASKRQAALQELARIDGVYWPAAYAVEPAGPYVVPRPMGDAPERIRARRVVDLDAAPFPTAPPVPWVKTVHDRGQIEIARGCTRGCRFCHAGMIYRPVRERSLSTLVRQAEEIVSNCGYTEISLVSLNCPDHTRIDALVDELNARLGPRGVSVGLPSLRVDTFSVDLARKVARVRKGGMTFAPEAATQRLRDVINKNVTEQDLRQAVEAAFEAGWTTVKLYFMMGLPTETDEDLIGIGGLAREVAAIGRRVLGRKAGRLRVNVSVAPFNPKPHTPFQWLGQVPMAELKRRAELIRRGCRDRAVRISVHDIGQSVVEAALARGDRRVAVAIENAWRAGAYLDAWPDFFSLERWEQAFADAGLDLHAYAERSIEPGAELPWQIIDVGPSEEFLRRELERALAGVPLEDCRFAGRCHGCGVHRFVPGCRGLLAPAGPQAHAAARESAPDNVRPPTNVECVAVVRYRKVGWAKWLSHLDVARAIERALRRAALPVAYSAGFNPRMKLTLGPPLPVGAEGEAEMFSVGLAEVVEPAEFMEALRRQLPAELGPTEAEVIPPDEPNPVRLLARASYVIELDGADRASVEAAAAAILEGGELSVERNGKRRDLTGRIFDLSVWPDEDPVMLRMVLGVAEGNYASPLDVLAALEERLGRKLHWKRIVRTGLYAG